MDVSRYSYECQAVLHYGLRYAKGLGHDYLEVEHVALALIRRDFSRLDPESHAAIEKGLELFLEEFPRRFGQISVAFGPRLNQALDKLEKSVSGRLIEIDELWLSFMPFSDTLRKHLKLTEDEQTKDFQRWNVPAADKAEGPKRGIYKANPEKAKEGSAVPGKERVQSGRKLQDADDKRLREFTTDLTQMASEGKIDPVIGREEEIRHVLEILSRKKKNNPILLGEPGVGKTAIAEGLALRIAEDRVPDNMRGVRVLSLDLGSLLAGTKYRGEFEQRLKQLVQALEELGDRAIIFIDEIHTILGAGQAEGGADAANLLKPALARGQLRCVGATTLQEFRKYFEKDAALERRFQPVMVGEPDRDACLSILRGLKQKYEIHHGIPISDSALRVAVDMSILYLPHRQLPDKAIDLLDEACAHLKLKLLSVPAELEQLQAQASQLKMEQQLLEKQKVNARELAIVKVKLEKVAQACVILENAWRSHQKSLADYRLLELHWEERLSLLEASKTSGNFELAGRIQFDEMPKLSAKIAVIKKQLEESERFQGFSAQHVDAQEIAFVLGRWTGIPVGQLLADEKERLKDLEGFLNQKVTGQMEAIGLLAKAVKRARLGLTDAQKPSGVFLFLGATGVGKTEAAKALAERVFVREDNLIRIDMTEYGEAHHVSRLIGAPPGYAGYESGGVLTDAVRHHPFSLVLLDEIDKAHPRVLDLLLQILDEGRLTDGQGRQADFKRCIFILTSNVQIPMQGVKPEERDRYLRQQLVDFMRPELVNRIDEIVSFARLGAMDYDNLLNRELATLNSRLASRELRVELGKGLRTHIINDVLRSAFAGRELKRNFQRTVVDAVSDRLLKESNDRSGVWLLDWSEEAGIEWKLGQASTLLLPSARA
ncbi:MAG: ATP-dependent Clp protease ATP-binding subunit [Oligoflexus sp.]|nr:ATP-dependent Clp protease ATP-binding subunit [Oligoflexus sp.]